MRVLVLQLFAGDDLPGCGYSIVGRDLIGETDFELYNVSFCFHGGMCVCVCDDPPPTNVAYVHGV